MTSMQVDMSAQLPQLQVGVIARRNSNRGFGYVTDETVEDSYIFLYGRAIKHSAARDLKIGHRVLFPTSLE